MSPSSLRVAKRLKSIKVSPILTLSQRARDLRAAGRDIIDLTVGEPDFDTPDDIKAAAKAAIDRGQTKYTALNGAPELLAAIAERMIDRGMNLADQSIIACAGAKQVISHALEATLEDGDEVILPAPYWTSYLDMVRLKGGEPVAAPGRHDPRSGWRLDARAIEAAITPRTRWLILNTPNNPTGVAATDEELAAVADVLRRHPQVWLMCDDIYEDLVYGRRARPLLVSHPDLAERALAVNGASKAYAMTGWRIGWGAGPSALIAAMSVVQSQTTSAPSSISQAAALAALTGPRASVDSMRSAFRSRRDLLVSLLNDVSGMTCPTPDGAFYAFPSVRGLIGARTMKGDMLASDIDISTYLLESAGVATVPGTVFGVSGYLRLSFAAKAETLVEACARIGAACVAVTAVTTTQA
ncbi:pyridoxal phosphate-dependent aminotransferase [Phenylobacterium sp.]|uniref:pyridoxal phosphate-dependent aminotransferase n=3 Tax=Phenylobacterium sp. TaxID=1871053 RepID=UPI0027302201|nr:pyridoxal phosphate-dependent aminotransferase [Phenylobacterium sp.]MDP1619230.1 pyridoxal phosphate-dependent aminotransferase [Phenylobacterium sp.]